MRVFPTVAKARPVASSGASRREEAGARCGEVFAAQPNFNHSATTLRAEVSSGDHKRAAFRKKGARVANEKIRCRDAPSRHGSSWGRSIRLGNAIGTETALIVPIVPLYLYL